MFGHHWEPADGTVIDVRQKGNSQANGSANLKFLVEVTPNGGGGAFRVELGMPGLFGDFVPPSRGQVVKMEVDVKNRDARFDTSDPGVSAKAQRHAASDRFAAQLTGQTVGSTDPGPGSSPPPQPVKITADYILGAGLPARAVVVDTSAMGRKNAAGIDMYALVLSVQQDGHLPRQAIVGNPVPAACLPLLYPGSELSAKVLINDPNAVAIDWAASVRQ